MVNGKPHIRKATVRPKKNCKEYFIWCDESDSKGKHCSNFYGGVLVKSEDLHQVQTTLRQVCRKLHLFDEIKWSKVSQHYVDKYKKAMDAFFDLVAAQKIKVRIMFTQNNGRPAYVTHRPKCKDFFLLYYQFVKHAFGLPFSNNKGEDIYLRLYFDDLPDTHQRRHAFKEDVKALQQSGPFQQARLKIRKQDIAEVDSKKHLVLQLLDVVLGSVFFRLNDKHREIPEGKTQRGKRTIAKEKLYKHIHKKLKEIRPRFHIGVNTEVISQEDFWQQPYRHWVLQPSEYEVDNGLLSLGTFFTTSFPE
jgi:hypothetical protein